MPSRVMLTAVRGPLTGTKYRFDEQMICMVGRSTSCMLQLVEDAGKGVSRHHCLLDIRPPQAFICDLESRNGTFVNGERLPPAVGGTQMSGTRPLATGEVIGIGANDFEVTLIPARLCCRCGCELPDADDELPDPSDTQQLICDECAKVYSTVDRKVFPSAKTVLFQTCSVCGARIACSADTMTVNGEIWPENTSKFICNDCLAKNPDRQKTFPMPALESRTGRNILVIPDYRVLKLIGRGGMGAVYLAECIRTLEKIALKILLPEIAVHDQCREDFIREANNLKPLKHPNIVELKECGYAGGALYLALEYCSEGTLREYLFRTGKTLLTPAALNLTCQILDALEYAHNVRFEQRSLLDDQTYTVNGLVHRDIKPANIYLTRVDGELFAKIADFGLAKAFDMAGISGCTRTGDFSGTLGFVPKQQFLNYKYVKPEVDVWAAAATLYYMLTGMPPRNFSNAMEVMHVFGKMPVPVREINPYVPEKIAEVIDFALDDRESLHFKTADQLRFALEEARAESKL